MFIQCLAKALNFVIILKIYIAILGLVINGPPHSDNPRTLNELGDVPLLCELPPLEELNAAALARQWRAQNVKAKVEAEINRLQASR